MDRNCDRIHHPLRDWAIAKVSRYIGWRCSLLATHCSLLFSHVKTLAEIKLPRLLIANQEVARAFGEDLALVNQIRAVDDAQSFADVVIGDDDADPALLQLKNHLLDLCD